MTTKIAEIGMIGLGVMGRNLLLNMADHGFVVAGYDRDADKVAALATEGSGKKVAAEQNISAFLNCLKLPRAIMLLVPAGAPVDAVIAELLPQLDTGDLIIDGGNSHFIDTARRTQELAAQGFEFLGVGVSGGEEGARRGPSMMPGGSKKAYARVQRLFETVAAKVADEPCVTWLGPGAAGHYVKMVHNGIEYGLMQLIAESYDLMKRGLGLNNAQLHEIYRKWNQGILSGFLLEITADIFAQPDERTGRDRIDLILDAARQKGTGMWTSQEAMQLQVPIPVIDMAVMMRDLSGDKAERDLLASALDSSSRPAPEGAEGDQQDLIDALENALFAAMLLTYVQGMALLHKASTEHGYDLQLAEVAKIWRGGCIIRAALLDDLWSAYSKQPQLAHLLLDRRLTQKVLDRQQDLRRVVSSATEQGIPVPALMTSLAYFDAYRSARLPANLIQAQRDYFGAHTYERIDATGTFHSEWQRS
ncbi:NADP-dependent phosphogluconate dehydrogenase [Geopsychrobacter electrodiphilus]|uniref:NADP-dependent phosphogluconate dehydrogenase n=1 Tax=Geopsychrobacter electrodiphilus TaxID=225196 RepID=UPI00036CB484|nr:NADP-dependent phosphogluconate dehydrogenase [Geopsychrobacter electrodiphilus]